MNFYNNPYLFVATEIFENFHISVAGLNYKKKQIPMLIHFVSFLLNEK